MTLQIELLETSFQAIAPHGEAFVTDFYERLFTRFPQTRAFFASTDMKEQRKKLFGTILLRLVEKRARQNVRHPRPGKRVTLCSMVSSVNGQAKCLFEREGYTPIRRFWRITVGSNDSIEKSARPGDFKADLDVDSLNLVGASQLYDLDAIYIIREYDIYEKELHAGELLQVGTEDERKVLVAVG